MVGKGEVLTDNISSFKTCLHSNAVQLLSTHGQIPSGPGQYIGLIVLRVTHNDKVFLS